MNSKHVHPLVGRASETQLQNKKKVTQQKRGYFIGYLLILTAVPTSVMANNLV